MRMAVSGGMLQDSCLDYRDRGDHFKLLGLKKKGQYKETLSSVFRHLFCICAPSYLQPQQTEQI